MSKLDLTEKVAPAEHVEVLLSPIIVRDGREVVGTVSLIKVDVVDFKSKQPNGDKLVYAEFVPNAGRKTRIRWKHLDAMHTSILAQLGDDDDDDDEPVTEPVTEPVDETPEPVVEPVVEPAPEPVVDETPVPAKGKK